MRFATLAALIPAMTLVVSGQEPHSNMHPMTAEPPWSALVGSMETMHAAMASVEPSGNTDVDFASLMLPHHRAALDMARTELLYGTDPRMRRLAQEIVTDQQSEIELMHLWLKPHEAGFPRNSQGVSSASDARQAPWGRASTPVSPRDRVYAADQTSNTVSVIDPSSNTLLGVIRLGDPVPGSLGPLYRGALLVHGLGYSPDAKTLAVVSVASNSVTLIETATNIVKGTVYVGRSPHEAFFTPNGRELWVTVRGENYVSVIDPVQMKETRRIELANGPGMTVFGPDGRYAFVCSSLSPELAVVDAASHHVVKRLAQASPFCPNIAVSPENDEVWITLKDVGKVQVFGARPPFEQKALLDTGPITNHVTFANNREGRFAYVTIGGANEVKAFRRGPTPTLVATIPVGELPHGIWPSGDGSRVYVAFENGGSAAAIDTLTNTVIANIQIGQTTQALVYVPNAVPDGPGTEHLEPIGEAANVARLRLEAAGSTRPAARGSAAVNSLGLLDLVELAVAGLAPGSPYQVSLAESNHEPYGALEPLAVLKTNPDGAGIVQAIGPLKTLAYQGAAASTMPSRRFLIVTEVNDPSRVVLRQIDPPRF